MSQRLLTPNQFAMCFRQAKKEDEISRHTENVNILSDTEEIVVGGADSGVPRAERRLVLAFWTQTGKLMILRKTPVVVDTSKFKLDQHHNRQYQELLMFRHWTDEGVFLGAERHSYEACHNLYRQELVAINEVADGLTQLLLRQTV